MPLPASERHPRLGAVRVYFVCDARPRGADPEPLLLAALDGGAGMLELREQSAAGDDAGLIDAARPFREACATHAVPFILNDRPDLVEQCGADGVHVGQDDTPVAEARENLGPEYLIGLSTHSAEQIASACSASPDARPDYISVGPVWETPTKEGRPGTGLELIEYAASEATLPWFAIGGIDTSNVGDVVAAGAQRIVVVRALRDAADPGAAAGALRDALEAGTDVWR
ncbi:MAG TPA: thiamine phosphate synthase [Solirubrobacterales bacterium]|jgi:thiamine-phosphate pyrophosphorylase|nr:thiamine phosphate synthase [Solirubrobacterales bacterium]